MALTSASYLNQNMIHFQQVRSKPKTQNEKSQHTKPWANENLHNTKKLPKKESYMF